MVGISGQSGCFLDLRKMTTLWFKVENGPAAPVEANQCTSIWELKKEIISQHPRMFGDDLEAGVWNLFRSDPASEPEDSGDGLIVLEESGSTSRTALVMRRVQTQGMTTSEY